MNMRDFQEIRKYLRAVWTTAIESEEAIEAWYSSFRRYDFELMKTACRKYVESGKFEPKPADIIELLPTGRTTYGQFDPTPRFEEINGKKVRVYICMRCRDTGMITFDDEDGYTYGKPCNCPAGHYYYRWGWLTEDEQREYIKEHGYHGEIIGENWNE